MLIERIRAAVSIAGVHPSNPPNWLVRMFGGPGRSSGIQITEHNALTVTDVFKCVRVLAETGAMLPWKMLKHIAEGTRDAPEHSCYQLMYAEPNDHMTSFVYRFAMIACLNLWGKHHSYVERNPATGKTVALWPLRANASGQRGETDKFGGMSGPRRDLRAPSSTMRSFTSR